MCGWRGSLDRRIRFRVQPTPFSRETPSLLAAGHANALPSCWSPRWAIQARADSLREICGGIFVGFPARKVAPARNALRQVRFSGCEFLKGERALAFLCQSSGRQAQMLGGAGVIRQVAI